MTTNADDTIRSVTAPDIADTAVTSGENSTTTYAVNQLHIASTNETTGGVITHTAHVATPAPVNFASIDVDMREAREVAERISALAETGGPPVLSVIDDILSADAEPIQIASINMATPRPCPPTAVVEAGSLAPIIRFIEIMVEGLAPFRKEAQPVLMLTEKDMLRALRSGEVVSTRVPMDDCTAIVHLRISRSAYDSLCQAQLVAGYKGVKKQKDGVFAYDDYHRNATMQSGTGVEIYVELVANTGLQKKHVVALRPECDGNRRRSARSLLRRVGSNASVPIFVKGIGTGHLSLTPEMLEKFSWRVPSTLELIYSTCLTRLRKMTADVQKHAKNVGAYVLPKAESMPALVLPTGVTEVQMKVVASSLARSSAQNKSMYITTVFAALLEIKKELDTQIERNDGLNYLLARTAGDTRHLAGQLPAFRRISKEDRDILELYASVKKILGKQGKPVDADVHEELRKQLNTAKSRRILSNAA